MAQSISATAAAFARRTKNLSSLWQTYGTLSILAILVICASIASPEYFLNTANIVQVLLQSSVTILLACGVFFTILIAGIDLSVGSMLALTGMVTAQMMAIGMPFWLAALLGIAFGGALGAVNGLLVNVTQLHPFIITLGTQVIFRGVTYILSDARAVFGFDDRFVSTIAGRVFGVPVPVLIGGITAAFLMFLAQYTKVGRNIYALGGNAQSAWYSGIDVKRHTLLVFIISGLCSGIAGIVTTARTAAAEPNAGIGFETFAIASAIIGGTSFFGGRGKVQGVVIGGLIIGVISNILNLMNVQAYYQQIVMGTLIIGAVTLDRLFSRK